MYNVRLHTRKAHNSGFTLIEMLVYLSLLIIITLSAITALITFSDTVQAYRVNQLLVHNASVVLERFEADVRNAQVIEGISSTLGVTPGSVRVLRGATTTDYALVAGQVTMTENGVVQALTSDAVVVDELWFHAYDNLSTELLRMEMTLSATVGATTRTRTFNTAAALRGSYE